MPVVLAAQIRYQFVGLGAVAQPIKYCNKRHQPPGFEGFLVPTQGSLGLLPIALSYRRATLIAV